MSEAFKSVIPSLFEDAGEMVEQSLLEATNILMKYIRQGIYSIVRNLYAKNTRANDLRTLFTFLESSAHPDVVSVTLSYSTTFEDVLKIYSSTIKSDF